VTPDELFQATQDAAAAIRKDMETAPQPSPVLALLHEQIGLTVHYQMQAQSRGGAVLQIAAQMAEQRAAENVVQPAQEATSVLPPDRPPGGVIVHPEVPFEETAQAKAEAAQREREQAQQEAAQNAAPSEPED
jgi:hypothetical protein